MPSPVVYGTAHLYGISGSIANATVTAFKLTEKHLNQDHVEDEAGHEIERRYDDLGHDADITLRIRSAYTIPVAASTLVYETATYEVVEVGQSQVGRGYRTLDLKLKNSANITYGS